jgi:hypothetical protein
VFTVRSTCIHSQVYEYVTPEEHKLRLSRVDTSYKKRICKPDDVHEASVMSYNTIMTGCTSPKWLQHLSKLAQPQCGEHDQGSKANYLLLYKPSKRTFSTGTGACSERASCAGRSNVPPRVHLWTNVNVCQPRRCRQDDVKLRATLRNQAIHHSSSPAV